MSNKFSNEAIKLPTAASQIKSSADEILKAAASGAVELVFSVVGDATFKLSSRSLNDADKVEDIESLFRPDFLALEEHHCNELYLNGKTYVTSGTRGWKRVRDTLEFIDPSKASPQLPLIDRSKVPLDNPIRSNRAWGFFAEGKSAPRLVEAANIFILQDQLEGFASGFADIYDPDWGVRGEIHTSSQLAVMYKASAKFWKKSSVKLDESATYPKTEDIIAFFEANSFSNTAAVAAASLIRPDALKRGGAPEK